MENEEDDVIMPNKECKVCGENRYELEAGFFYCKECGTRQDDVQDVQIDEDNQFADVKYTKGQKVKVQKAEKPNLTSWECYNYILRGFVEELMCLGAKEEVKLLTLQLWAAYLRRKEVAFFNKKHAELPRLGAYFHKRDANILYNHANERKKRKRADDSSKTSGDTSKDWRRTKRKYTKSLYSDTSASSGKLLGSSSSGTTSHAIQIKFSSHARKVLKKQMPVNHIKKHERDAESTLGCHNFPTKISSLTESEQFAVKTTIRELYTILAIALNLAEDEIQLTDLVRYIAEGHIGTKNVLKYFPENVANYGKQMLRDINFHLHSDKASYRSLRENIQTMSKFIDIQEYCTPNLASLAVRYIAELNLPSELATYVERLMGLFPPQMKMRSTKIYPAFEARAMAYIVFVLKLLFGLDGIKEKQISKSAAKLNEEIQKSTCRSRNRHAKLFVWNEWVEYIEMRKVIISQFHSVYGHQFKVNQSISQKLQELKKLNNNLSHDEPRDCSTVLDTNVRNLRHVMEKYLQTQEVSNAFSEKNTEPLTFPPSFTPSNTYYKRIQLHAEISTGNLHASKINIPDFMHTDHTQRTLEPYLSPGYLQEFCKEIDINLHVESITCAENKNYVGFFIHGREFVTSNVYEADFNVKSTDWRRKIVYEPFKEEVKFKKLIDCYTKKTLRKLKSKYSKRRINEPNEQFVPPTFSQESNKGTDEISFDVLSLNSFEVFSENNMDPIQTLTLNEPRRNMDSAKLLENIVTKSLKKDIDSDENENEWREGFNLQISEMDCWLLFGHIADLDDLQKKNLENVFPRSFFWLLETCANVISVDWGVLYDQLMAIEITFAYGIESLENFTNFIRFSTLNENKDINRMVNWYREIW